MGMSQWIFEHKYNGNINIGLVETFRMNSCTITYTVSLSLKEAGWEQFNCYEELSFISK